jgi:tetratricopeptide (TPR) repeat protein
VAARDLPDTPAFKEAFRLAQAGRTVEAEETADEAIYTAEMKFGPQSPQYATAQNDRGRILTFLGQHATAVEAYRKAAELEFPGDPQATRDRLTYLMNLGQTLEWLNRLDEAEEALRRALKGRREFYGRDHPGHAFGLEPLAALLARKGNYSEALKYVSEAVRIFWKNNHVRVTTALVRRACILKEANQTTPPFAGLDTLSDSLIEEIVTDAIHTVLPDADPAINRLVLKDLLGLAVPRLGEEHRQTINLLIALSNAERTIGDAEAWAESVRRVLAIHDRLGQSGEALQAAQGLAMALSVAGRKEEAEATYRDAVARAERVHDLSAQAQVARNFGLFLAEIERRDEATPLLRAAMAFAEKAGNQVESGRCRVALGIFLQHGEDLDEARELLAAALEKLHPAHPDALVGRSHLQAIEQKRSCGCGDMSEAFCEALKKAMLGQFPAGLVDKLDVGLSEDRQNLDVGVHLDREPTEAELQLIERIVRHAREDFRKRISERK